MKKNTNLHRLNVTGLALLVLLALALSGFDRSAVALLATPTTTASPTPAPTAMPAPLSPQAILEASAAAMEEVDFVHFEADVRIEASAEDFSMDIPMTIIGDFQAPDRVAQTMSMSFLGSTYEIESVQIGDTSYVMDSETGRWMIGTVDSPIVFTSPKDLVEFGPSDFDELALIGEETLDSHLVYHLKGNMRLGTFGETEDEIQIEYWIGIEDALMRQLSVEGEIPLEDEEGGTFFPDMGDVTATMTMTMQFSDYGKEVAIEAPLEMTSSPFGSMMIYESAEYPFAIQYPADWMEQPPEAGETARFVSEQGGLFVIAEEDVIASGLGRITLEEYVDLVLSNVASQNPGYQLASREEIVTPQGLPAEIVEFTVQGYIKVNRLFYLHEDGIVFNATYVAPRARHDELKTLIGYSLDTFRVQDAELYVDEGVQLMDSGEVEMAIEIFSQAIELDPDLAEAYINRAWAYRRWGDFEAALADINQALELMPDDPELYGTRANVHWVLLDDHSALMDVEQAVDLDPEYEYAYNIRALIYASQGKYEEALTDVTRALELRPAENASFLDTRGYIYLKSGQYEEAKADYEEIFDQGLEFPYALLGGGLTYAALGETDEALDLLERGLEEAKDIKVPDPQMADLLEMAVPTRSNLRIAVLAGSDACPPECSEADLSGADLPRADLFSADLSQANLSRSNLAFADLSEADLSLADLSEANLAGADLSGADLSQATLEEAVYDETTTWPSDLDPVEAGALILADAVEKYMDRGLAKYDSGSLEEAIQDFGQALELDPDAVQAYVQRGTAYLESGNPQEALLDFNQALERDLELVEAYVGRGEAYQALGDLYRAIADYGQAIDLDPAYGEAYLRRGTAYGTLNEPDRAVADFDQAIELDPDNAEAYNFRGVAYKSKGENERAITDYSRAIELDPDFATAYGNRAYSYSQLGNYEQAIADYDQVIQIDPTETYAYNNRGWAYSRVGDYEQAIADYTQAIELDPGNPNFTAPYNNRGWAYYLQEDYERALADFNQAIELNPSVFALIRRAVVYETIGDAEQAARDFEQAIENFDGEPADAHDYVAWTLVHDLSTHYEEALEHALRSVELEPGASNHDTLALIYYKLGEYEQALEHYDIALSFDPGQLVSIKGRADVYVAQGDMEAALADYESYFALASEQPGFDVIELKQVIESLDQYLELEPEGEHREAVTRLIAELEALLPTQP